MANCCVRVKKGLYSVPRPHETCINCIQCKHCKRNQNQFKLLLLCVILFVVVFVFIFVFIVRWAMLGAMRNTRERNSVVSLISDVSTQLTILLINKTIINCTNTCHEWDRVMQSERYEMRGLSAAQQQRSSISKQERAKKIICCRYGSSNMSICINFQRSEVNLIVCTSLHRRIALQINGWTMLNLPTNRKEDGLKREQLKLNE